MWSIYRRSPIHYQEAILRQLNLPDLMEYASSKVKKEILDEAPLEIKQEFEPQRIVNPNPYMGMPRDELLKIMFPDPKRPMEYWLRPKKERR